MGLSAIRMDFETAQSEKDETRVEFDSTKIT